MNSLAQILALRWNSLPPTKQWLMLATIGLICLLAWNFARLLPVFSKKSVPTTIRPSPIFSTSSGPVEPTQTNPPIDLTIAGAFGQMPPPDDKIFSIMPVARPSELSVFNGREGDTKSMIFNLTDLEIRLSTVERALENDRRGRKSG
jgi:hypothetical protein